MPSIQKISARVFCQWKGIGGNPVTIFAGSSLNASELAQTCSWESISVDPIDNQMAFYMPTGEQVSFCAHAAMGGALFLAEQQQKKQEKDHLQQSTLIDFRDSNQELYQAQVDSVDRVVSLHMDEAPYSFQKLPNPALLLRLLRETLQLPTQAVRPSSFGNASIARPKTLVRVKTVEALQQAVAPRDNPQHFQMCCDSGLDQTTGIYLYAQREEDGDWECRQFPRASGYPEDPATGVAAAALAAFLDDTSTDERKSKRYRFHQGTAMGQDSLIVVDGLKWSPPPQNDEERRVSFQLVGHIQIDDREWIEV